MRGKAIRNVHVERGQTLVVHAGAGVELEIVRLSSGAVDVRNLRTNVLIRQWGPKEARTR